LRLWLQKGVVEGISAINAQANAFVSNGADRNRDQGGNDTKIEAPI
jgi:hypothetical protein